MSQFPDLSRTVNCSRNSASKVDFLSTAGPLRPQEEDQTVVLDKDAIDLNLLPAETVLKGKILPAPHKGQVVKVLLRGEDGEQTPDSYGRFQLRVHRDLGEQVRVDVCADGQRVNDDYVTSTKDEVNIPMPKPDVPCSN